MTTYSSLKYDHAFSSNATGTGSLTLISSQTASASASISFTTGIDSTYDEYIFKLINIHPAIDAAELEFNFSTDNGSNYNVTKTTTIFIAQHSEDDATADVTYNTARDKAQSTLYQRLGSDLGADNDQGLSGTINLFAPSNTTFVKHFIANTNMIMAYDRSVNSYIAGYGNTTSAINAIDFKMSSGNIDDGIIKMYGVK